MNTIIQKLLKYPSVSRLFLKYPQRRFTILEISRETKMSYATTWRHIRMLEKSGVIFVEKIGGYNVCSLNTGSPLAGKLKDILKMELSPHRLAVRDFMKEIEGVKGIEKIILFGSVARGGENLASDADIAIICKKDKNIENKVTDISGRVLEKTRINIVPIMLTKREVKGKLAEELNRGEVLYKK